MEELRELTPHFQSGAYPGGEGERAMAPLQESGFILSEFRFRDKSAIFIENLKGITFGKKIRPIPRENPGYATAYNRYGLNSIESWNTGFSKLCQVRNSHRGES